MNKRIAILVIFCSFSNLNSQTKNLITENRNHLIDVLVSSFEKDICKYYNISKNDANKAIDKFTKDTATERSFIKKISQSSESKQLLQKSNSILKDYIWILNKGKRRRANEKIAERLGFPFIEYDTTKASTKRFLKEQSKSDNFLTVNYFDKFSEEIIRESKNKDIKDIIFTLRETPDSSPYLITSGLSNLKELDFKNKAVKIFIAFELYYTALNQKLDE